MTEAATPSEPPLTPREIKTNHIKKAAIVFGVFAALISGLVLLKGVWSTPRHHRAEEAQQAPKPSNPDAALRTYQQNLEQYRQQPAAALTGAPAGADNSTGTQCDDNPEDVAYVKSQQRLPMLVKDIRLPAVAAPDAITAELPQTPGAPAEDPAVTAMRTKIADLQKRQAALANPRRGIVP